jgi:hypothetical protein
MRYLLPLLLLLLPLAGCDGETCEGACYQYYGEDACNQFPDGSRTKDQARLDCEQDCYTAMYTAGDAAANSGRVLNGGNEHDAVQFIRCVSNQDYSDVAFNDTCVNRLRACGFTW